MYWEKKLAAWVEDVRRRAAMPLRLVLWNGDEHHFWERRAETPAPAVTIRIPHASALPFLLTPSLSNLGRAYVEGLIEVEGKAQEVIRIGMALAHAALKPEGRFSRLARLSRHTKRLDEEAIRYHYDVSNDFYRAWLDERMVYSCAYFERGDEDLGTAQLKKIDHILTKIRVRPDDRLLDVGCGWGALAIRAAQKYGARCVGITLSENQAALARERVAQAGLADRVEIRLEDYRDVTGTFDRITSVGMFEHVGLKNLPLYFRRLHDLLADDGVIMNHGITSTDPDSGGTAFGAGDFIGEYVFPHGELPHISRVLRTMQEGGLEALDVENLRRHYARTCALWAENFEGHAGDIRHLVDPRRYRIWRVYLAGCAYAFEADWIALFQVVAVKSGRKPDDRPWSRRYMYGLD